MGKYLQNIRKSKKSCLQLGYFNLEHVDKAQFKSLIDAYIYSGREPIKNEVFQCLDNRPSILQARTIDDRIVAKMKEFVEVFAKGMMA